ncbi:MAG: ABC transporter ATP-binding protein [Acidimicrobiales bacterium]|nr:ABC transporter ATP-binding protein [Acidimicrobiales bacterium]MYA26372.1 ABC transporter ATP-binding protein [Acidimicrobiales bacterium]MYA82292.1 ABC transporter ATP-binding protein [Acidimicrobiales bacterium]MYD82243.1 ABC transporter ATP-binding protein [Acidimicrobiales bacterium]MYG89753.1 ABC transporter ATP-binding protein [Acidimicrobiales bacterium]
MNGDGAVAGPTAERDGGVAHGPGAEDRTGVPAVEMHGISKRFGDVVAVDEVDLEIGDGEFFALLGPSGCGKTTTLRMIAGLDIPSEGRLAIFGEEVASWPPDRRPVNTVFQAYALFPHMTVAQNIAFGLQMRGIRGAEADRQVAEATALVRLEGMEQRRPSQLSGGQQQRVALARALVNHPKVLLLDEPLGALDLKLRQEMQTELKALQREVGITFIFVTHDQEEALAMSDRVGVMSEGRLLQVGTPAQVYEHPANRFVADFIGRTNLLEGVVESSTTLRLHAGAVVAAETDLAAGTPAALSVRPEQVRLHGRGETPQGAPCLDGVIGDATYLGHAFVYTVSIGGSGDGATTITVRAETGSAALAVGEPVSASWLPATTTVVAD